jgi:hypothetical protein
MKEAERFRLLGNYQMPRFRYGRKVLCEARGGCNGQGPVQSLFLANSFVI